MSSETSGATGATRLQPATTETDRLMLAIPGPTSQEDITLTATVKNLSTTGIILETCAGDLPGSPEAVKGKDAAIVLPANLHSEMAYLAGKILWARGEDGSYTVGLDFTEPLPTGVRRTLESQMEIASKDIKELWDQWDQIHGRRQPAPPAITAAAPATPLKTTADKAGEEVEDAGAGRSTYWVGFGVIAAGAAMQFIGPDYLKFSGLVLIIYGSALVALKSIWGIWQGRRSTIP